MSLFAELKRRNVFRVGIAYGVTAWLILQLADIVLDNSAAPAWVMQVIMLLLAIGLPLALLFAWAFEMTPEGIRKERDVDRTRSITHQTGHKLDRSIIVVLVIALAYFTWDKFGGAENGVSTAQTEAENVSLTATPPDLASAAPQTAIAVLPFANRSNKDDDLFFTDGIHDDLLTQLAKIHELKVISRTSMMEYRDTSKNLKQIGAELAVGTILEGGVQKVGDRVRVNAQLIEVATDRHLWAETYDRELTAENIFEIQSEIAREIVRAVAVELTPEEERSISDVPTRNLAAYEAWLRARVYLNRSNYSANNEREAKPWLKQAIALDPDFSEAHASLAGVYGSEYWRGQDTSEELLVKYRAAIDRVLQLKPGSASALLASADYLYRVENDYRQALQLIEKALEQAPGNAYAYASLGLTQRRLGQWHESIASFGKALALDPANHNHKLLQVETMASIYDWQAIMDQTVSLDDAKPGDLDIQITRAVAQLNLSGDLAPLQRVFKKMPLENSGNFILYSARVHWLLRDPDATIEILNSPLWAARNVDRDSKISRNYELANAYRLKGDQGKAQEHFQLAVSDLDIVMNSALQIRAFGGMTIALSLARLNRFDEALKLAGQLTREIPYEKDALIGGNLLSSQAMVIGLAGDQEEAINELKIALEIPSSGMTSWDLYYDPNWDFMRDNPRFVELATPANLIRTVAN
jgi:TolB-like protein